MIKKLAILLLCLTVTLATGAQTTVWDGSTGSIQLADKLKILEDPEGQLSFDVVSSAAYENKFTPSDKKILNVGHTESVFWLKIPIDNTSGEKPFLELMQACLPLCELYYKDENGQTVYVESGYKVPLPDKVVKDHFQVFPLPTGSRDYYVRLVSNSGPIPVNLYTAKEFEIKSNNEKLVYGFYLGFMFFLLLSNLFFFFSLRNGMYLFYCVNVVIYTCYTVAVVDGFLPYLLPNADLMTWYITVPTIGVAVQNMYAVYFLELKKYAPRLNKIAWGLIWYFIIYAVVRLWLPLTVVLGVNTLNALLSFFMIGVVGFVAGKRGNKMGYYFAIAFFIYFAMVMCEATYIQTGSPAYFWSLSYTATSTLVEAFVLSFLLSKRFEWEKEAFQSANNQAQKQLLEKTRENEKMVREQNTVLEQKVEERTYQLTQSLEETKKERQKAEKLLHNILPEEVAEELKQNGAAEARQYDHVSVLFTDFVNFTGIGEKMNPKDLVAELDLCFRAFDEIIEKYGLEKIKTIGDAYLAVCGLPTPDPAHAENAVNAALDILEFMEERRRRGGLFEIRAGINSGPLVAGIVGVKKFAYDIWGDTVNTAARMETNSDTGKLNVTDATYELIKDKYKCEYRGKIDVKNKGVVDMYFVSRENVTAELI